MRKISILILLLVLICCKNDIKRNIITNQEKEIMQEYIEDYPDNTQFSIAIIKNNEVEFIGYQIVGDSIKEIDNKDSVFEVGSITKLFTSTILASLVKKNTLKLDDAISDHLPFQLNTTEENAQKITFKTLANHTSGLPNYPSNIDSVAKKHPLNPYLEYDSLLLKVYLENEMKLLSVPGDKYEYSNLGYGILGYLLEIKTGKSYENLLKEYVFEKYGMTISTTNRNKVQNYLVSGLNENGDTVPNWDLNIHRAAGDVLSSTNDLSMFVLANFSNDSVLNFQRQSTFSIENNDIDLALGWHIFRKEGITWYFHNGRTGGYRSNITMDLEKKNAIILLVNCVYGQSERHLEKISWRLLRTIE